MSGSTVGHLTVYTEKRPMGAYWWSKQGDQRDEWRLAQIDIKIELENDKILIDASITQSLLLCHHWSILYCLNILK